MRRSALAGLGAAVFALAACDSNESVWTAPAAPAASSAAAAAAPQTADLRAATEAARVGTAGSGCKLPVTFGIAESWKPKAVQVDADDPLAELARKGPMTMVCEIDAKPAGNIGFLRVYTGKPGDLKTTLTAFIGAEAQTTRFTNVKIGDRTGLQVAYKAKNELEDTLEPERAFIVKGGSGLVAVALDSLDGEEHQAMLPAFELARTSLAVAG